MAESAEHQFLSSCVTGVLNRLAKTQLYSYAEAERRKFDFACELHRDWSRPLVGQTLWSHVAGVDKDLRTMLLDPDAEICTYVARDTMKARRLVSEGIADFRASGAQIGSHRLRVFWIPEDFDADKEDQRSFVENLLTEAISKDLLMNILLGNLTAENVRMFIRTSGRAGLHLAVLHNISTTPEFLHPKDLAEGLGVSPGAIKDRLLRLLGSGFLDQFGGGLNLTYTTPRGRAFLDLCAQLQSPPTKRFPPEMEQILRLLDLRYAPSAIGYSETAMHVHGPLLTEIPEMALGRLLATIKAARDDWSIDLTHMRHALPSQEGSRFNWGSSGRAVIERLRRESST